MRNGLLLLVGLCVLLAAAQCAECALDDASEHADSDDLAPAIRPAPLQARAIESAQPAPLAASASPLHRIPRPR